MFGKKRNDNALEPPPVASDARATEVLRVWAVPGQSQQLTLRTTWKDAGAWGLLLADVARHAAAAYAKEGQDQKAALARIRELFEAEWEAPTDEPKDITDR